MSRGAGFHAPPSQGRARQILIWTRWGAVLFAACCVLYLVWRFDTLALPRNGASPLATFAPGAQLLLDRRKLSSQEGDAFVFRDDSGTIRFGRLAPTPRGELREGLWLVADFPDLHLPDSYTLGPIALERIVGRVVCALPGME